MSGSGGVPGAGAVPPSGYIIIPQSAPSRKEFPVGIGAGSRENRAAGKCPLLQRAQLFCIRALPETCGANIGIDQFANWSIHPAAVLLGLSIRAIAGAKGQPAPTPINPSLIPKQAPWRFIFGAPAGTRTPDTLLKRQVLYLLSYWGVWLGWRDSNPLYRESPKVRCVTITLHPSIHLMKKAGAAGFFFQWGGIWGSNPRHPEPQSGALPTELIPPSMNFLDTPYAKSKQDCGRPAPDPDFSGWHAKRDSNPRPTA